MDSFRERDGYADDLGRPGQPPVSSACRRVSPGSTAEVGRLEIPSYRRSRIHRVVALIDDVVAYEQSSRVSRGA
jgi:hypothetical protein